MRKKAKALMVLMVMGLSCMAMDTDIPRLSPLPTSIPYRPPY